MKPLKEIIKFPLKKGSVHERQEAVQALCDFMSDQRYSYWNGRTKKLRPETIHELMKIAQMGDTPQKFFNYLLKKELE